MEYRVEKKYLISNRQIQLFTSKLKTVMKQDLNQQGKVYYIRSLYFDDIFDSCMNENEAGVNQRSKLRIRTYDYQAQKMYLENKEKLSGFTKKTRDIITRQECLHIMDGNALPFGQRTVVNKLSIDMKTAHMVPKTIIEYERTALVHILGNTRVTFDQNITASRYYKEFLSENVGGKVSVLPKGMHILEVKYDEFLPDFIAGLLEDGNLTQIAFSKYYLGRFAINGEFIY